MNTDELSGPTLKRYRKQRGVTQQELADEMGRRFASYVCRVEARETLTRVEFADAVAAIERVAERKLTAVDPMKVLQTVVAS